MPTLNFIKQTLFRLAHQAISTTSDEWYNLWSIGIYTSSSPVSLMPAPGITNPVLRCDDVRDVCSLMVADPFTIKVGDIWYMFFELYTRRSHGEIGCAISNDGFKWTYQVVEGCR